MQKSVPIYVKALRENDVDWVLIPNSNNPVASSVLAKEKTKLQTQIENIATSLNEYYLKAETYSKEEVNGLFEQLAGLGLEFKEVQTLPATGENKYIYLVPKTGSTNDIYDEYIWINGKFERIGSTAINLADYYTSAQIDAKLATKGGLSSANTWSGTNNFTGNLTKNGVNVATESQIPKVDSTMSTTSTNAIQNKVVKTELDKKGGKSSANTWSANNNFTGGLQKNGVDVATTTQVNQKITMPTALEGGYLKYTQEKGAHWALVESSGGGGNTSASKDIYVLNMDLGLTTVNLERSVVNNLLNVTEDLKAGDLLIDKVGNIYRIWQLSGGSGGELYLLNIINAQSYGNNVIFIDTEITDINNFPQENYHTKYANGSYILDNTGKIFKVIEFVPSPLNPNIFNGTYKLELIRDLLNKNVSSTPTPLKSGDAYPEFIYFDTSRDITDILAGLTYNEQGLSIIAQFDTETIMVSIDISAYTGMPSGLAGYCLVFVNETFTKIDFLFVTSNAPNDVLKQFNCTTGWNQRLVYTGDLSSQTLLIPTSFDFMYAEDLVGKSLSNVVSSEKCFKVFSYMTEEIFGAWEMIFESTKRFCKTAHYCAESISLLLRLSNGVVHPVLLFSKRSSCDENYVNEYIWESYESLWQTANLGRQRTFLQVGMTEMGSSVYFENDDAVYPSASITWTNRNNFTGPLQKNGVDVATVDL